MSARVQTWFPFSIQVCMNGREWLSRRMDEKSMAYTATTTTAFRGSRISRKLRRCWIAHAQDGLAEGTRCRRTPSASGPRRDVSRTGIPLLLVGLSNRVGHRHRLRLPRSPWPPSIRNWSAGPSPPSIAATSCDFSAIGSTEPRRRDHQRLPGSPGRRSREASRVGQLDQSLRQRRLHSCGIETTINNPEAYRSYRSSEADPDGESMWRPMRRGRGRHVSPRGGFAGRPTTVTPKPWPRSTPPCRWADWPRWSAARCRKTANATGHCIHFLRRTANFWKPSATASYATTGFCNRDLASRLYPSALGRSVAASRTSSKVSYRLRILRSHGLIRKSPGRRRYHMTTKGRQIVTALLQVQHATLQQLNALAA